MALGSQAASHWCCRCHNCIAQTAGYACDSVSATEACCLLMQGLLSLSSTIAAVPIASLVIFSSTAALLVPAGQANYAAANAAVNAWASARQAAGGTANAVQWGAWASGMAAVQPGVLARLARMGMVAIPPAAGLRALVSVLTSAQDLPQVCHCAMKGRAIRHSAGYSHGQGLATSSQLLRGPR